MLTAAAELLVESGYETLSLGAVAERAGVGRQTVYRWWSAKAELVGEAVLSGALTLPVPADMAAPGIGLAGWLGAFASVVGQEDTTAVVRALAAAAAEGGDGVDEVYARYTAPAHEQVRGIGLDSGLDADAASALADAVLGALLFRVLTRAPITSGYLASLGRLDPRRV